MYKLEKKELKKVMSGIKLNNAYENSYWIKE